MLKGLGSILGRAAFDVAPMPSLTHASPVGETVSFLDAQAPAGTPLTETIDRLDARFDGGHVLSPDEIVVQLVPASARPDNPDLN